MVKVVQSRRSAPGGVGSSGREHRRVVLSVLFAGVVGASLVFVLGALREEWHNDREGVGILRLVLAEIEHTVAVIQTLEDWAGAVLTIDMWLLPRLKTEVWRDVRVRAAQLLPEDLTMILNDYYSPLDNVVSLQEVQDGSQGLDLSSQVMMDALAILPERRYTGPSFLHRDYAIHALEMQDEALNRISEYLSLRPWMRQEWLVRMVKFASRSQRGSS
jgi:hypothetical protein